MQGGSDHMHSVFGRGVGSHVVAAHISTASPPLSPANSPRRRSTLRGATGIKGKAFGSPGVVGVGKLPLPGVTGRSHGSSTILSKLTQLFMSLLFFRRHRLLLLIPFVYITGTLLYMGGSDSFPPFPGLSKPGSYYRSHLVFQNLWPEMELAEADSDGVSERPHKIPSFAVHKIHNVHI